ncbi:MAG TPA: ATP-binding cassette domain-containing protein, partial [Candidatus Saccharimonadales bacterium]|nr:ATP-binding cassette domain-containing protein [Candidatus Saccharimonadales bacterium]
LAGVRRPEALLRADRLIRDVALERRAAARPHTLSGGEMQRVAIARALVIEPQLILYDEPTSELDPLSAVVIGEEILNLKERIHVTSIVVTHDRDLAFGIADRIAMMYEGELLAIGSVEEIKHHSHPVIHRFLNADFKPNHHRPPLP